MHVSSLVRIARLHCLLLLCLFPALLLASEGELILRDAQTGFGLDGQVMMRVLDEPVVPTARVVDQLLAERAEIHKLTVRGRQVLDIDRVLAIRADVPGYRSLHAVLRPDNEVRGRTLMLQPEDPWPLPESRAGRLWIIGWVHDAVTLSPLSGATVQALGQASGTDSGGYFALEVPAPEVVDHQPEAISISVSAPGYPDWVQEGVLASEDVISLQVALGGPSPSSAGHRQLRRDRSWPEPYSAVQRQTLDLRGSGDEPPSSITVGFADASCTESCCTGSCPHACTMSLEEYVRRGLPKEWIASWQHDALAAGAVAYRSYGAWHVFNPPAHGAYDLCSSACCQVNAPGTHGNTNLAVAATSGLMLMRNDGVFRSEYSAQNNCLQGEMSCTNTDLSCGNGFVGSPDWNWPCLADPVGLDRDCFGHGRGMSQWGNHFWTLESEPMNWAWQLDHYYNAHGLGSGLRTATVSQVMVIEEIRVFPRVIAPGQGFIIELDVRNLADESHDAVIVGASVRQLGEPFIDDSDNDQPVALPPGPSTQSRQFVLPADAVSGDYQLWAALWIDVDGDAAISSDDLAQHLVVIDEAVRVDEMVFIDRFEGE